MKHRISCRICLLLACLMIQFEGAVAGDISRDHAMVVVVSSANPIKTLTRSQVEDIFLGRSQQFPDGQRAVPIDQADGSLLPVLSASCTI